MKAFTAQLQYLAKISICQIADALGPTCSLETSIRPIHSHFRICGPALTVECAPNDNLTLHHALHIGRAGQVLIVSGGKNPYTALWGELMSMSARKKKLGGTIVDGLVRDYWEVEKLGYPLFAQGITPRRASKENYGSVGTRIQCGSLSVEPGDIIVADVNGILAIPAAQLTDAVRLVKEVVKKENAIKKGISKGRTIFEILNLSGLVSATSTKRPGGRMK